MRLNHLDRNSRLCESEIVRPETRLALIRIINQAIKEQGYTCNLNFIDTSLITDMSHLFEGSLFNGDISKWNVSKVEDMKFMFYKSKFNGDISKWNVSKVKNLEGMFERSVFNRDISNWNVSNVEDMRCMFADAKSFNQDLSGWRLDCIKDKAFIFKNSPLEKLEPKSAKNDVWKEFVKGLKK